MPALLVTHDFAEAALLGDEVAVVDRGRVVQRGSASELAAAPGVVLRGRLRRRQPCCRGRRPAGPGGLTAVELDGGGEIFSTDDAAGRTAASVFPWEVTLEPPDRRCTAPPRTASRPRS